MPQFIAHSDSGLGGNRQPLSEFDVGPWDIYPWETVEDSTAKVHTTVVSDHTVFAHVLEAGQYLVSASFEFSGVSTGVVTGQIFVNAGGAPQESRNVSGNGPTIEIVESFMVLDATELDPTAQVKCVWSAAEGNADVTLISCTVTIEPVDEEPGICWLGNSAGFQEAGGLTESVELRQIIDTAYGELDISIMPDVGTLVHLDAGEYTFTGQVILESTTDPDLEWLEGAEAQAWIVVYSEDFSLETVIGIDSPLTDVSGLHTFTWDIGPEVLAVPGGGSGWATLVKRTPAGNTTRVAFAFLEVCGDAEVGRIPPLRLHHRGDVGAKQPRLVSQSASFQDSIRVGRGGFW